MREGRQARGADELWVEPDIGGFDNFCNRRCAALESRQNRRFALPPMANEGAQIALGSTTGPPWPGQKMASLRSRNFSSEAM